MLSCECGSKSIHHDTLRGELVCQECGLVVEENLATAEAHYTRFTSNDHSEPLRITTTNPINNIKVKTHAEKRLEAIYHEIKHKEAPQDTKDRAFWLAKKYLRSEGRLPIHSLKDFADATVYMACQESKVPYQTRVSFKFLMKIKRHLANAGVAVWNMSTDPRIYLDRTISRLALGREERRKAAEILDSITSFTPATRAAVSIALALEEMDKKEIAPSKIAESAGISASTLWKARKKLQGADKGQNTERTSIEATIDLETYYFPSRLARAFCVKQRTDAFHTDDLVEVAQEAEP